MVATDKRFAALSLTLKHGIKLLWMIRLCPLPYSISNGGMSTFPTVTPAAFFFATAAATPKLLIQVWIGDRLSVLAAAEDQKMDPKVKILNWCSIIFGSCFLNTWVWAILTIQGIVLGVGTGWFVYRRTITRAKQLEELERAQSAAEGNQYNDESGSDADLEASQAAGLIGSILDGDEIADALFSDEYDDDQSENDLAVFLGDNDRITLEDRETAVKSPGRAHNGSLDNAQL
jgi:hypothetical protein